MPSIALSAIFPVAIVFAAISAVVILAAIILVALIELIAISLAVILFSAIIADSTAFACIVAVPVTFPLPSKDADVQTTSPVIPIVLPVANAVAVSELPVTLPSKFATSVPVVYPVPPVFTVVVGALCKSLNNFHLPESPASLKRPAYKSCDPLVSYNP